MKIALCFCGHVRTGDYAADNILRYIGDLFPNVDFFMHTWKDNYYKGVAPRSVMIENICKERNCTYRELPRSITHPYTPPDTMYVIEQMQEKYKIQFKKIKIESFVHTEVKEKMKGGFTPHWYSWAQSTNLKKEFEVENNFKYDIALKIRPDILFPKTESLQAEIDHCLKNSIHESIFIKDDVLYIGTSEIMDRSTDIVMSDSIPDLGRNTWFEKLHDVGILVKRTSTQRYGIYRPENVPENSLNFIKCFNVAHDWYTPSDWVSPYKGQEDI